MITRRFAAVCALWCALLAQTGNTATLLVANKSEASVSLLQLPAGNVVATLTTGLAPHEVAVSPDGRRALVSNYGDRNQPGATLTLVDIEAAQVTGTINLPDRSRPHGVEWLDNQRAAVTAEGILSLLLVDADEQTVIRRIPVNQNMAHMVTASAALGRAFTANIGSGTSTVIDLEAGVKLGDMTAGDGSEGIALARGGSELWVSNRSADTVSVFDTTSLEKQADIPLEGFPIRVEADDARGRVFVTLPRADAMAVIDVKTRAVVRRVKFDIGPDRTRRTLFGDMLPDSSIPIGVLLSGDGTTLFVAHSNAHVLSSYDATTLEPRAIIPTGLEPDGMAWSPLDVNPRGS
jgi:DNA-binding beta-propeller fold protein YncE